MIKRILALLGVALIASVALSGCGSNETSSPTLTLVTWGGTTADGIKAALADPFTKETGIQTNVTEPVDYGKYAAMIQQNQVTWDWVDLEGFFVIAHLDWWAPTDTNLVKIDPNDVIELPGSQGIGAQNLIRGGSYSFAIAYRTDNNKPHPTTWAEFFDTKRFPGKRAVYNNPYGMLEVALLADGDLVFWNSGAELQQIMTSGEADYAYAWNNRIADIQKKGAAVAIEWNQNLQDGGFDVTAKNGPHVAETMQYFAFTQQPKVQADYARATGYSPTSKAAFAMIPDDEKHYYNVYPANMEKAVGSINLDWWAKNYDSVTNQWNTWAGQ
jgi:putative spermidine/putrescine transport system substrate-binding protein